MKVTVRAGAAILLAAIFTSCTAGKQANTKNMKESALAAWFSAGDYLNGLAIRPHKSINVAALYEQYGKHKERWDAAFSFLKEHNLKELAVGKYEILGSDVYASVTEGPTRKMEDAKWECHHIYADIQYVISGKETMGVAPIAELKPNGEFNDQKDVGFGNVDKGAYYTMDSTMFQLFFPSEAHRPNIGVESFPVVKKVVIKVKCG